MDDAALRQRLLDTQALITMDEARLLTRLAGEVHVGAIVEIGSYKGGSTVILAKAACGRKVHAIDPHTGITPERQPTWNDFRDTLHRHAVADQVVPIVKTSMEAFAAWEQPIGLLWIDGSHKYRHVRDDFTCWQQHVVDGGVVALHDARRSEGIVPVTGKHHRRSRGPARVVNECLDGNEQFETVEYVDSIAFARKLGQTVSSTLPVS